MAKMPEKRGLGRGLSALLGDVGREVLDDAVVSREGEGGGESAAVLGADAAGRGAGRVRLVPVERLAPNPEQPRRHFPEAELEELAASIRRRGIIQPILVRPDPDRPDGFQIVAGERRWRAAQRAQLHEVPVIVGAFDDRAMLEIAIIENVQRADLDPVDEATAYRDLIERFGYSQEGLAEAVGKSRSHVANTIRLLALPAPVLELLRQRQLSAGHARALLAAPDPVALAHETVRKGLSVRQVEARVRHAAGAARRVRRRAAAKDPDTRLLEGELAAAIGMGVEIVHRQDGSGEVRIRYRSLDELDRLCRKLSE